MLVNKTSPMKVFDATPPVGFPAQVVVLDADLAKRMPEAAFYLRVEGGEGVTTLTLTGEHTLPGAIQAAISLGYEPTHWMEASEGQARLIPDGVRPRARPAA